MTGWPRLHQSIAKELVTKSPEHVRQLIEGEREKKSSKAMQRGTLVDQLVFGGAAYQVVDATYKSGPRKGQPCADWLAAEAVKQKSEILARGQLPVLQSELEKAQEIAGRVKSILLEADFKPENCRSQHTLQWTSSLGIECEGTPDFYHILRDEHVAGPFGTTQRVDTFDLKVVENCNPDYLEKHVFDMGWDIQAAAYQEAVNKSWKTVQQRGTHYVLAIEPSSLVAVLCPLGEAYVELGKVRWERAQRIWRACLERNQWPGYTSRVLSPPNYVIEKETKANV